MSLGSISRICSHQLLPLLLVLHHLLDSSRIADLLHLGVPALALSLLSFCLRPLLAGTLQMHRHSQLQHTTKQMCCGTALQLACTLQNQWSAQQSAQKLTGGGGEDYNAFASQQV